MNTVTTLKRRYGDYVKALFILAGLAFLSACSRDSGPQIAEDSATEANPIAESISQRDADVIIIGSGLAGLSAALEAASRGRSVLVIDMASVFGGHAVMSAGGLAIVDTPMQRDMDISDDTDMAYNDFVNWGEDINEPWARYYVDNSRELIYDWATGLGVVFNMILRPPGNSVARMHFPEGLGLGLIAPLMRAAVAEPRIAFRWNTRADALIRENSRVTGVSTTNVRTGEIAEIYGHAIVIATGGYQSNLSMVRDNWRPDLPEPGKLLAGSGWNSRGSGLDLATGVGADLIRMDYTWNYVTGVPDPRYDDDERGLRFDFIGGLPRADIWVNDQGNRFVNECLSPKFSLVSVLEQPGKSHWLLFDARQRPNVSVAGTGWTAEKVDTLIFRNNEIMNSGNTIAELADDIGVDAGQLEDTVDRYNEFVNSGEDGDFHRFGENQDPRGGCTPEAGIDQPPYFAVKRYPLTRKSMGGISIDLYARVLNTAGAVIPGLYAAGEATGLAGVNGRAGLEGTFLGPSLVTGRVAGKTISEDFLSLGLVESATLGIPELDAAPAAGPAQCEGCHNLSLLTTAQRPGYQHFELSHGLILERGQDCAQCHVQIPGFGSGAHKIRTSSLVDSCENCHGSGGD